MTTCIKNAIARTNPALTSVYNVKRAQETFAKASLHLVNSYDLEKLKKQVEKPAETAKWIGWVDNYGLY